jgi:alkanesulfonate monooxygenase SsuD/methylene tetrahydromethanopterin reductase-like flavin-dependent oxidoreductase (luciferase family)
MKFGFFVTGPAAADYPELLEQAIHGEELGFDTVWLRERHFNTISGRNLWPSPLVIGAYIAAKTSRLRIGIGSRILPLDHPIHIAEDTATLDVISGGRLDFGIARVGENDLYQKGFGVSPEETRGRFEEGLDIILQAWTQLQVSYQGKYYKIPEVTLLPKPIQRPHPPVFVVGKGAESIGMAARKGFPIFIAAAQMIPEIQKTQEFYWKELETVGYRRDKVDLPVNRFIYVTESMAKAKTEMEEPFMKFLDRGTTSDIKEYFFRDAKDLTYEALFKDACIFGDPDYCIQQIERLQKEIDLRYLLCTFNYFTMDLKQSLKSMEMFAKYVMPRFKKD